MGKPRGQRNAAREKQWPGQDSGAARAFKRGAHIGDPKLEDAADAILRANGSEELIMKVDYERPTDFVGMQQTGALMKSFGKRLRGVPNGKIKFPGGDARPAVTKGPPCPQCGKPKFKGSSPISICRPCYSLNARKKYDQKVHEKYDRIAAHIDRYSHAVDMATEFWMHKERCTPDFAPDLIEEISEIETAYGATYQELWAMAQDNPFSVPKPIFRASSPKVTELPVRIKQGRKFGNWLRGVHLGKAA